MFSVGKFLPREAAMLARCWDRNSVCLSVTRVLCDEKKELTAYILIPHEREIILVFSHRKRLVGDVPLKFELKVTPPLKKADFDQYLLITAQP